MPAAPAIDSRPSSRSPGFGSAALLGAVAAVVWTALPDAVLQPYVERTAPWALALLVQGVLFTAGALGSASVACSGRRILLVGGAMLLGGLVSAELATWLAPALGQWLAAGGRYYPLIVAACAAASAPVLLPAGALAGIPLAHGGRALAALLVGAAAGFLVAPWLTELALGRAASLRAAGLVGAAASIAIRARAPLRPRSTGLMPGASAGLMLGSAGLFAAWQQVGARFELGSSGGAWLTALTLLGAAAAVGTVRNTASADSAIATDGTRAASGLHPGLLVVLWIAALPMLLPSPYDVQADRSTGIGAALGALALLGMPIGWVLGGLLARRGRGLAAGFAPVAALALVPFALWLLVPVWGLRAATWLLAALGMALTWRDVRRSPQPWLPTIGVLLLLSVLGVGRDVPSDHARAELAWSTAEGPAGLVPLLHDTGGRAEAALAIGGRAALTRSTLQSRRLIHLPLLLHDDPDEILLVASDQGESARAVLAHGPDRVIWLEPFPNEHAVIDTAGTQAYLGRSTGTERLQLLSRQEPLDAIVLAPDPLLEQRAGHVGTVEFFELAAQRLAPDGIFCQWWDLSRADVTDVKRVIAGAHRTFAHTYLLLDHPRSRRPCVGIVGRHRPLRNPVQRIDDVMYTRPAIHADMEPVGLDGLMVACCVMADSGMLRLLAPEDDALHDERPALGVRKSQRRLFGSGSTADAFMSLLLRRRNAMAFIDAGEGEERFTVSARTRDVYRGWHHLLGGTQRVLTEHGDQVGPFEDEALGQGPETEAAAFIEALPALYDWPYLDGLILGHANRLERSLRLAEAEGYLRAAVERKPWSPPFRFALARIVERRGRPANAAELYRTVLEFDAGHPGARAALGRLELP